MTVLTLSLSCNKWSDPLVIGFWNVENLFDLKDDPTTRDEEFAIGGRKNVTQEIYDLKICLLYTSPSPRDVEESRMPSSA